MDRIRILLTSIAVLLCSLTTSAHDFEVDGIYYNITSSSDFTVSVTFKGNWYHSYSDEYSGEVVIPEKVTYNSKEYSVTSIGDYVFEGCSGLTSVTIPNSVTSIGYEAFYYCSGLTSVTIPNSVTSIGGYAFHSCSGLTEIKVESGNSKYDSRENCNALVETESNTLIFGCKNTTIPNSVTSIGKSAFYGCSGLISVTIPNSVTSIGEWAFYGCPGLTSVAIPNSVTSIGEWAFYGCLGLTSVTIPNSITSIESGTFSDCSGLTSVTIPNSVTSIGDCAFEGCSGLVRVTIGNSVKNIGEETFKGCSALTNLTIPKSVTSIDNNAFEGCISLKKLHIEDGKENLIMGRNKYYIAGEWYPSKVLFSECALNSLYLGRNIENKEDYYNEYPPFKGTKITQLIIGDSVTNIGEAAFANCFYLTNVKIGKSVVDIGEAAFSGCNALSAVHIKDLSAWCKIKFDDYYSNPTHRAHHLYLNDKEIIDLVIPEDVTSIGQFAFEGCSALKSVTFNNSIVKIGGGAFSNCGGLTKLVIPESCETVQPNTFLGCIGLEEITLPSTCIVCYDYSFEDCTNIKRINCNATIPPVAYDNTFSNSIYSKALLNVPDGCADTYKETDIWKKFTNITTGGVIPETLKKCASPTITYSDGQLLFASETNGAKYKYTLTDTDIKTTYTDVTDSSMDLSACYTITAYAYAEGYMNSDEVTATLYWIKGGDISTNINQTEMRGVITQCSDGMVTVSGLANNETVQFYTTDGALLYTTMAQNGTASYAVGNSLSLIVVKIGDTSIKVKM